MTVIDIISTTVLNRLLCKVIVSFASMTPIIDQRQEINQFVNFSDTSHFY
jgi:hypothetical protein